MHVIIGKRDKTFESFSLKNYKSGVGNMYSFSVVASIENEK
jgi:hypothetical protein